MARQCPKPKRKRDATWFRDKVLLVKAQGSGKVLNEEELEFLVDPGVAEGPVTKTVITHNATYQADDLDAYNFDYDDFSTAKAVPMANLSSYGSDVLSEDTNSSAQQDAMILSVFEQLSNQVTNCNKANKDNLIANESLYAELERYKERNPFYLKKAQQIRPMLYDGSFIAKETNVISIADSEETLMLEKESRSKILLKHDYRKLTMVSRECIAVCRVNYTNFPAGFESRETQSNPFTHKALRIMSALMWSSSSIHILKQRDDVMSVNTVFMHLPFSALDDALLFNSMVKDADNPPNTVARIVKKADFICVLSPGSRATYCVDAQRERALREL
ncbi:hypothetical protein Tco_1459331 [Tanacetum coccineum]